MLLYGGYLAYHGDVTVGVLAAFLLYLRQFFEPMMDISQFYNTFQSAIGRAGEALRRPRGGARRPRADRPGRAARRPRRRCASTTCGSRTSTGVPVLPDLDLTVPAGQTVALVGTTGAGKTTHRQAGHALLRPDRRARCRSTASTCASLTSTRPAPGGGDGHPGELPLLRHRSPTTSASAGPTPRRTTSRRRPARSAPTSFIAALPEGYDTDVSNRGGRLSAGQRQLVAFARAFLADPAVLILDEATSSLDIPSERLVQRALRTILADRTAVIIAHRLSTVEIADRVLVLEHGRIVEDGTPADLIAGGDGRFSDLHEAWLDVARLTGADHTAADDLRGGGGTHLRLTRVGAHACDRHGAASPRSGRSAPDGIQPSRSRGGLSSYPRGVTELHRPGQAEGWREDPYGRHELRFFDGHRWTPYVRDGEDQRIDEPGGPIGDASRSERRSPLLDRGRAGGRAVHRPRPPLVGPFGAATRRHQGRHAAPGRAVGTRQRGAQGARAP